MSTQIFRGWGRGIPWKDDCGAKAVRGLNLATPPPSPRHTRTHMREPRCFCRLGTPSLGGTAPIRGETVPHISKTSPSSPQGWAHDSEPANQCLHL